MTRFLLTFSILLIIASTLFGQNGFSYNSSKKQFTQEFELQSFQIENLEKNLKSFLKRRDRKKFEMFIVNTLDQVKECDVPMYTVLGFYSDSLFLVIRTSLELPIEMDEVVPRCLNEQYFPTDTLLTSSSMIVRLGSELQGGSIFGEAGWVKKQEYTNEYVVRVNSTGLSPFSKTHNQYSFFFIQKDRAGQLFQLLELHPTWRDQLSPDDFFLFPLHEDAKKLKTILNSEE